MTERIETAAKVRWAISESEWYITYTDYGDRNFEADRSRETDPDQLILRQDVFDEMMKLENSDLSPRQRWVELREKIRDAKTTTGDTGGS